MNTMLYYFIDRFNKICKLNLRIYNKIKILCLSGGAAKCNYIVGCLHALESIDDRFLKNIEIFIGTSSGSIICYLMCIGYTPFQIFEMFLQFQNPFTVDGKFLNLDPLFDEIKSKTKAKHINPDITFSELFELKKVILIINAYNLKNKSETIFNKFNYPSMSVLLAVRLSCSIPGLFNAIRFNSDLYIDGGLIDNFPIKTVTDNNSVTKNYFNYEPTILGITTYHSISYSLSEVIKENIKIIMISDKNVFIPYLIANKRQKHSMFFSGFLKGISLGPRFIFNHRRNSI